MRLGVLRQARAPQQEQGTFSGISATVITTMLASVSLYLRSWSAYDRLSDSVGNTAYSIFSTEKDHFDFIIGWSREAVVLIVRVCICGFVLIRISQL